MTDWQPISTAILWTVTVVFSLIFSVGYAYCYWIAGQAILRDLTKPIPEYKPLWDWGRLK